MRQRRTHSEEFKREAVRLALRDGMSQAKVARDLGLHSNLLNRWVSESMKRSEGSGANSAQQSLNEVEALQRKLDAITVERDILKKRWPTSLPTSSEVWLCLRAPSYLAGPDDVQRVKGLS